MTANEAYTNVYYTSRIEKIYIPDAYLMSAIFKVQLLGDDCSYLDCVDVLLQVNGQYILDGV